MLSVIICTHNPKREIFAQTLRALGHQENVDWSRVEIIVVDNASSLPFEHWEEIQAVPSLRIVQEDRLGLTHARLRGLRESSGSIIVFVDDDNVLRPDYLHLAERFMAADDALGVAGGRALPVYEADPPSWFTMDEFSLGCRDLGDQALVATWRGLPKQARDYPACSPIGGGMVIRREALEQYANNIERDAARSGLDRRGQSLASGGDNDIVLCALDAGYSVAYFPSLILNHLIPRGRLEVEYLERYQRDSTKTWLQVLDVHGICPWAPIQPWTLPLRKARSYLRSRAWKTDLQRIRWKRACGVLEGQAAIFKSRKSVK